MGSLDDVLACDATAQADLVRRHQVAPAELVGAAVEAAIERNPAINAIIHPRFESALEEAAAVHPDDPHAGPFAGVPMVVKDLGCAMAGEPHHSGTRALKAIDYRAPHDSALYRRFRRAGFVAIGRTNTPEWGSTITTEPLAYGPSRNPWNLAHSTGGSSGGSAAAVAAGIVAVGHANDGGGSIRVPASECGLVGLKPSRGRVSLAPDAGEGWAGSSIDGAVTRSVRDAAAVLDAIAGYEPGDPYSAPPFERPLRDEVGLPPGRLRVGVLDASMIPGVREECVRAVRRAAELMSAAGHHVEASAPAAFGEEGLGDRFVTVMAVHTARDMELLEEIIGRPAGEDDLEPDNLRYGAIGRTISATKYLATLEEQHAWSRRMLGWWHPADGSHGFDLLLTPVLAAPPPEIGYLSGPEGAHRVGALLLFTAQFNVTGQPAISLPLHVTADGLPVGVQLVADHGREDVLVRVASQLEEAAPWTGLAPR
jgi:amidase